jgi:hypothetical protein
VLNCVVPTVGYAGVVGLYGGRIVWKANIRCWIDAGRLSRCVGVVDIVPRALSETISLYTTHCSIHGILQGCYTRWILPELKCRGVSETSPDGVYFLTRNGPSQLMTTPKLHDAVSKSCECSNAGIRHMLVPESLVGALTQGLSTPEPFRQVETCTVSLTILSMEYPTSRPTLARLSFEQIVGVSHGMIIGLPFGYDSTTL